MATAIKTLSTYQTSLTRGPDVWFMKFVLSQAVPGGFRMRGNSADSQLRRHGCI